MYAFLGLYTHTRYMFTYIYTRVLDKERQRKRRKVRKHALWVVATPESILHFSYLDFGHTLPRHQLSSWTCQPRTL